MGITEDRQRRDDSWDAEAIRRLRRYAGLSQRALAEQLNARQQTISEWERGAYAPRGTAARLLTRVAEDVEFPFEPGAPSRPDGAAAAAGPVAENTEGASADLAANNGEDEAEDGAEDGAADD